MGRGSVAHVPQDAASREVFQGLFKDLGNQAMALEAILRAVCGRVDKLENWLTEVSFGMTELDLKLRNIAHNIDGTAAVDDEVTSPMRWSIPTEQVKPAAPTVSKKLGADKKGVRVTGMAAAILDQLATTSTTTTPSTESDKPDKVGTKKKAKDKKHNAKKAKPEVPTTPHAAEKETLPPAVVIEAGLVNHKPSEAASAPMPPAVEKTEDEVLTMVAVASPLLATPSNHLTLTLDDHEKNTQQTPTATESSSTDNSPLISAREGNASEEVTSHDHPETLESPPLPADDSTASVNQKVPEKQSAPLLRQLPSPSRMSIASTVSTAGRGVKPKDESSPSVSSLFPTVQVKRVAEPFVLSVPVPAAPIPPAQPSIGVDTATNPTESTSEQSVPTLVISDAATPIEPCDVAMPTEHQTIFSDTTLASMVHENPPLTTVMESMPTPEVDVVSSILVAEKTEIPAHTSAPPAEEPLSVTEIVRKADDPLIMHRKTSQRRASKAIPRPSFSKKHESDTMPDLPRRASGKKPGSRHNSFAPQPKPPEIEAQTSTPLPEAHETNPAQLAPKEPLTVEIVPQQPPPVAPSSAPANTAEPVDANEDSDDSESEESSNGSDSSSSDEEDPSLDDAEAGAAVEEINKAMTALKKLKHAHMLSPEEEKALKERAHKKWFQLKGQIKEKQKKDVTNILLKRKKNVFTVSSRIELLEEKSREIFAALKQFTNEMRDKTDRSAHEILRRRVGDIEHSLQSIDAKFASLPVPAPEKENDFSAEVDSLRSTLHLQLSSAEADATARHAYLEVTLANQRALIESMAQDFPVQLNTQAEDFTEKLKQIPDYSGAIESLKRSLRRKADLKLLKELEARLLGLDAENEDCLVRCLSCRKEVLNPYNEGDVQSDEQDLGGSGLSQLRRVNPGPSSARIYRSNVPFSAQHMLQEPIIEESSDESMFTSPVVIPQVTGPVMKEAQPHQQLQSAGDSYVSERPPVVRAPVTKWSAPIVNTPTKTDSKTPQASPLSLMNINATRAILSPDRPISAPVVPQKRRANSAARSKSLLKSLPTQLEPPL